MPKFNLVYAGDELFLVRGKDRWNGCWNVWPVKIISIDSVKQTVVASWNGNTPRVYSKKYVEKLRRTNPNKSVSK